MSKVFVWSDPHFFHKNIIDFRDGLWPSLAVMHQALIDNHNSVVSDDDTVICNGDFMFSKSDGGIFNALNGKKILVKGNHDHFATTRLGWQSVHDLLEFKHNGKNIVMFHYPIESWNEKSKGSIHLFGHVHDQVMPNIQNRFDICVEKTNYTPVNLSYYTDLIEHKDYKRQFNT
jgi:calcineurin-like phosphoesterase family protein